MPEWPRRRNGGIELWVVACTGSGSSVFWPKGFAVRNFRNGNRSLEITGEHDWLIVFELIEAEKVIRCPPLEVKLDPAMATRQFAASPNLKSRQLHHAKLTP